MKDYKDYNFLRREQAKEKQKTITIEEQEYKPHSFKTFHTNFTHRA